MTDDTTACASGAQMKPLAMYCSHTTCFECGADIADISAQVRRATLEEAASAVAEADKCLQCGRRHYHTLGDKYINAIRALNDRSEP